MCCAYLSGATNITPSQVSLGKMPNARMLLAHARVYETRRLLTQSGSTDWSFREAVMPWCGCCAPAEMAPQETTVALKPGHSLMDWVRLGHSGVDLTGVGGVLQDVTPEQLAAHGKGTDAWIAIRGSVYNVTHYMDFHPGGKEELMRGVGKDGTDLFNQIHPWVNYESLLQKCRVGRLVQGRPPPPSFVDRLFPKKSKARLPVLSEVAQGPQKNTRMPSTPSMTMDWFQQMATVTLQFFTKGAVPQTRVMLCSSHRDLIINIKLDKFLHVTHIVLEDNVCWPAKVKTNYETGTVEVQFTKEKSVMWKGLGDLQEDNGQVREVQQEPYDSLEVVGMCKVNHNTQLLLLRHKLRVHVTVPIGYSVPVLADINDVEIVRSYTPVAAAMEDKFLPSEWSPDCLCLMVKECPGGQMSPYLCTLKPGDVLKVGQPVGSLRLSAMDGASQLCLLSAGSGFTPMIQIILWALGSGRKKRFQKVNLLCYNLKERDIMWQEQLEALAGTDSRFSVTHILIEPDSDWRGPTCELTLEILQSIVQKDSFVCVCGPDSFRKAAVRFLGEMQHPENLCYVFQG
ncbi:cytochrome b5 reductase 4 isoform X2 [Periplaneta americana]|uniref:cytochrome b5 reductase 4 isoform X2 n=1 Tax=Periplaneta americana TaxID=6978 RepID=UPI0037E99783